MFELQRLAPPRRDMLHCASVVSASKTGQSCIARANRMMRACVLISQTIKGRTNGELVRHVNTYTFVSRVLHNGVSDRACFILQLKPIRISTYRLCTTIVYIAFRTTIGAKQKISEQHMQPKKEYLKINVHKNAQPFHTIYLDVHIINITLYYIIYIYICIHKYIYRERER